MTSRKNFEIAIVGGGISGLVLGIALDSRGIPVTIYEQAPTFAEIGAGVGFTANAIGAMQQCSPGIHDAFEKVRTRNVWESKKNVYFDFHDGMTDKEDTRAFTITDKIGMAGCHRAHFLDELIKMFPDNRVRFGKRLDRLYEDKTGRSVMRFVDGSTASADAVIGCDGIKSNVRRLLYGDKDPRSYPTYTYRYAYRALADMEEAIKAVGEEMALNSCMHMMPGRSALHFPINHGKILNIVAFVHTTEDWTDTERLTRTATREDALRDFAGSGRNVTSLLKLCKPNLDVWGIFHLGDNPLPFYARKRVCLIGDAAHATSPHHGAGAGICIEDAAVMASLLDDENVQTPEDVEVAFAVFDRVRRDRGNWLVQTSNFIGKCYGWQGEGVGKDFGKIEHEIQERLGKIADGDVPQMCEQARTQLRKQMIEAKL